MLGYWLYLSNALSQPRSIDDALIYLQSLNRNPHQGITGYLHREEGLYAQYVEGPQDGIEQLKHAICTDGRHRNIRVLAEGPLKERRFCDWDMAFSTSELSSFRVFQRQFSREEDLQRASAEDIMKFMADTARRGWAILPGQTAEPQRV